MISKGIFFVWVCSSTYFLKIAFEKAKAFSTNLSKRFFFFFLNFQGNQKLGLWPCAFLLSAWILFLNPNNQRSVSKLDHFRLSQLVLCGFKNMLIWSYILLASFIHLFGLSSKNAHNLSIERRHLYFQFTPFIIRRVFEIKPKSITLVF